ncbi:MAG: sulfatase-like hydrolase/transferase [Candidatus Saccharicenans sp.]
MKKSKKKLLIIAFQLIPIIFLSFSLLLYKAKASSEKTGWPGQGSASSNINLLLISIDTIRPDRIGCYSQKYLKTPAIESIASDGVVFTRAFSHTPMTLPSHTTMLTGLTPATHGVHDNARFRLDQSFLTMAEYLKQKGFRTAAFVGAFPLDSRFGLNQGFDLYDDHYVTRGKQEFFYVERKAEKVIGAALNWLKEQPSGWFVFVHLYDPHQAYSPPEPFKTQFANDLYSGEVAYVDHELGKLFDYLRQKDLLKNTYIIITGDHGESLGEHGESTHGYFAYNSTLWIPLIISGPGIRPRTDNSYVFLFDLFPTVCDLVGGQKPPALQGTSLVPLFKGKKIKTRKVYFESLYAYYNRGWAPITGFYEEEAKFLDCPIPEFYNLRTDFNEETNLVSKIPLDKYRSQLQELIASLGGPGGQSGKNLDAETMEKLRSLGYLAAPTAVKKENFGPSDDLKTLLPLQERFSKAMGGYHHGKVEEAKAVLLEIMQERKDFDLAFSYLATIYKNEGNLKEAIRILQQGLESNPESYSIISTFGILLSETGLYEQALSILQKGITLWPYDPEMWNYLGVAYWGKGEYDKAYEAYQQALEIDNDYPLVLNNLGSLYLSLYLKNKKENDLQTAIDYFKKALEYDPEQASAYNGLGGAYKKLGRVKEAVNCWEKALEYKPDYAYAAYNLGITYFELGLKKKAEEYLQKYLEIRKKNISLEEKKQIEALIEKCK